MIDIKTRMDNLSLAVINTKAIGSSINMYVNELRDFIESKITSNVDIEQQLLNELKSIIGMKQAEKFVNSINYEMSKTLNTTCPYESKRRLTAGEKEAAILNKKAKKQILNASVKEYDEKELRPTINTLQQLLEIYTAEDLTFIQRMLNNFNSVKEKIDVNGRQDIAQYLDFFYDVDPVIIKIVKKPNFIQTIRDKFKKNTKLNVEFDEKEKSNDSINEMSVALKQSTRTDSEIAEVDILDSTNEKNIKLEDVEQDLNI